MTVTRRSVLLASTAAPAAGALLATPAARAAEAAGSANGRRTVALRDGWRFALVDPGGVTDPTGAYTNAPDPGYDDSAWREVAVPHDWSIEQTPTTENGTTSGTGFFPGGLGWYRLAFTLPPEVAGTRISVEFDGVYMDSYVYCNGTEVGRHPYGCTGFALDLTDLVRTDGTTVNVLAVKVQNRLPSSRWYSGSGIYREARLVITEPVHVERWGTRVTTPDITHTGGPANAAAEVADNDLAVGRTVDEISHSRYWKDSAIFVVEDDSQNGLDHIDGHRAPVQIISPYARHGVVDSHYYSQITMVRTIEQILGIHPMNQLDSAATPMYGAFSLKPDSTPFTAQPNRTSLTLGVSPQPSCGSDTPAPQDKKAAAAPTSTAVPEAQRNLAAQWRTWASHQRLTGAHAVPDYADPEQMNRYTWYQTHDFSKPYPGDKKVYAPNDVPGAYIPSSDSDG